MSIHCARLRSCSDRPNESHGHGLDRSEIERTCHFAGSTRGNREKRSSLYIYWKRGGTAHFSQADIGGCSSRLMRYAAQNCAILRKPPTGVRAAPRAIADGISDFFVPPVEIAIARTAGFSIVVAASDRGTVRTARASVERVTASTLLRWGGRGPPPALPPFLNGGIKWIASDGTVGTMGGHRGAPTSFSNRSRMLKWLPRNPERLIRRWSQTVSIAACGKSPHSRSGCEQRLTDSW